MRKLIVILALLLTYTNSYTQDREQMRQMVLEYMKKIGIEDCLLYTSPSPRDRTRSRMPSSA